MNKDLYLELLEKAFLEMRRDFNNFKMMNKPKIDIDMSKIHSREGAEAVDAIMTQTNSALGSLLERGT